MFGVTQHVGRFRVSAERSAGEASEPDHKTEHEALQRFRMHRFDPERADGGRRRALRWSASDSRSRSKYKDKRTWRVTRCREGVSGLRGNLHGQALEVCGSSRAAKRGLQDYTDGTTEQTNQEEGKVIPATQQEVILFPNSDRRTPIYQTAE